MIQETDEEIRLGYLKYKILQNMWGVQKACEANPELAKKLEEWKETRKTTDAESRKSLDTEFLKYAINYIHVPQLSHTPCTAKGKRR